MLFTEEPFFASQYSRETTVMLLRSTEATSAVGHRQLGLLAEVKGEFFIFFYFFYYFDYQERDRNKRKEK
jgi:hypothetical protein